MFKVGGLGENPPESAARPFLGIKMAAAGAIFLFFAVVPLFSKSLVDRLLISCYSIF